MGSLTYKADDGMILETRLEKRLATVLRAKRPALPFANGALLPEIGDLPIGATSIVTESLEEYGEAAFMATNVDDVPFAEVTSSEERVGIGTAMAGSKYNILELEKLDFAAQNGQYSAGIANDVRMDWAVGMIEAKMHKVGAYGSPRRNLEGFLNHSAVPLIDSSFDVSTATQTQLIQWVSSLFNDIVEDSNMVEQANVLLCTNNFLEYCATTFRENNSDLTIYDAIKKVKPSIAMIQSINELRNADLITNGVLASDSEKERMVIYNLNPRNVRRHFSPMRQLPPEKRGVDVINIVFKSFSGVIWDYPMSARYIDFPKIVPNT